MLINRIFNPVVFLFIFLPGMSNAGILNSEWGMSPDELMSIKSTSLKNKSIRCEINCAVMADYTMFANTMKAKYWFNGGSDIAGSLKEVWLDSVKFRNTEPLTSGSSQISLFNNFKQLYTKRYGKPKEEYRDDTMKLLGIITYRWVDEQRKNIIQLENWLDQVRVKYKPLQDLNGRKS